MTDKINPKDRLRYTRAEEREAVWFLGGRVEFMLTDEMTDGRIMLYHHVAIPGAQPPLHEHEGEDEIMIITKGRMTFWAADQVVTLGPGDCIVLPKDLPHTFRSEEGMETEYFVLTSPAAFEGFVREASEPATHPGADLEFTMTPEREQRLHAAAKKHGVTLMAPPGTLPTDIPGGTEPVR
ncbi:MAG: cupin domain-containing protein [Propionibacteriaceae bacterium]|nr:cupin domain-containing protein [Propionibacteriaceae bacterium]